MTIQLLSPDVAGKIAAGEVVERPANVAKELIENSLDAGATEIRVEIREGGQRLLRVTDNGHGIPKDELPLALQRHATSKVHTAEDLTHIETFGFRGEALYSIAAVSHLTLSSRHRDEDAGMQVRCEGGQIVHQGPVGLPVGTVVTVEHIFFNTPARRKFLRRPATEAGHISAIVQRYALAHPERRFSLVSEGRLVFQSTGSGRVRDVLAKIYGVENARQMVGVGRDRLEMEDPETPEGDEIAFMDPVDEPNMAGATSAEGTVSVGGFVSLPTLTRANRNSIDLFVNRRYIEDRSLTHAVIQAYHTLLPVGRFPVGVIFIEIDPREVDVNVHPRKTEVRFQDARRIFSAVQKAVRQAIVQSTSAPHLSLGTPTPAPPAQEPGAQERLSGWAARRDQILQAGAHGQQALDLYTPPPETEVPLVPRAPVSPTSALPEAVEHPAPSRTMGPSGGQGLPPLRVVGQVGATYIVAEGPEGLYLIDQHAAHERIMYEKFMAQRHGSGVARQGLLDPLTLHVGDALAGLVAQHLDELAAVGFEIEPFGGDAFLVRSVPSVLAGQDAARVLEEIVHGLMEERDLVGEELEARLVKMVCKRASIKAGQVLSDIEMKELVRQLEVCQSPRTCPHGRPTMIQLSSGELERAFKRT